MLDEFLPNADLSFGLLGTELWSGAGLSLGDEGGAAIRPPRRSPSSPATCSCRVATGSRTTFESERAHGLLAPWVLHTGLGPDAASSGFMTQVIAVAVQEGGMPVPRGGGAKLAEALVRLIEDNGGTCRTGAEVESIVVRNGTATGVRLAGGETVEAAARRDRQRDADPALRPPARQPGRCNRGGRPAFPVRALGDADPLRALGAGSLGGRRAARARRRSST